MRFVFVVSAGSGVKNMLFVILTSSLFFIFSFSSNRLMETMLQLIYYKKCYNSTTNVRTRLFILSLAVAWAEMFVALYQKYRKSERQWVKYWPRRHCWHCKSTLLSNLHNIIIIFTIVALEI